MAHELGPPEPAPLRPWHRGAAGSHAADHGLHDRGDRHWHGCRWRCRHGSHVGLSGCFPVEPASLQPQPGDGGGPHRHEHAGERRPGPGRHGPDVRSHGTRLPLLEPAAGIPAHPPVERDPGGRRQDQRAQVPAKTVRGLSGLHPGPHAGRRALRRQPGSGGEVLPQRSGRKSRLSCRAVRPGAGAVTGRRA